MIHAYNKYYLDDAMRNLGEAFDYVVHACHIELDEFVDMFVTGGFAAQFGCGVPKYVSGLSGTELVWEVLCKAGKEANFPDIIVEYNYSPEYWCGWILAYYQWYMGYSFKEIRNHISMEEVLKLYPTLHEAAEQKFVDTVNAMILRNNFPTKLQTFRRMVGYSQRILSEKSGVSLRMIQQYEQRAKNINKATGTNLHALAKALGCQMEELLEPELLEVEVNEYK